MSKSPIFIHSLFRAGSTYLFNVFRRSTLGYWCYQEPLHELVRLARNEPEHLLSNLSDEAMRMYRHPQMDKPYFQELYETWPAWKDAFSDSAVFDGYFAPPNADIGIPYWRALIDAAQGRPVFQECRTAGRIRSIKDQLGGYHIYLWRNSWDQWWSYKVTPYFDVANQLIINAPNSPPAVHALRAALGFQPYAQDDLGEALAHFSAKPLTSDESYLVFYLLWCLGLQAGTKHAHLMLNIDRLSDSPVYQGEIQAQLAESGIAGIDFSDCQVPQGFYLEQDRAFFTALEDKVHHWLKEGGWSQEDINQVQALRQQFQPASWSEPIEALNTQDMAEQASRSRDLARRFETNVAEISREGAAKVAAVEAETHSTQDEARALTAEAESRAALAEARAHTAEAESRAALAEARTHTAEAESRAALAEARTHTAEAESRAALAEARTLTAEAESRAAAAEARTNEQEQRAHVAESHAQEQELRIDQLGGSSHHWWLQACALETERNALRQSWSWRSTAPLRWGGRLVIHGVPGIRQGATHFVHSSIKAFRYPLAAMMRVVLRNPSLSYRINQRLLRYPALHQKLLDVARRGGVIPGKQPNVVPAATAEVRDIPDLSSLTPRAREIYNDLKTGIENRQKEQG